MAVEFQSLGIIAILLLGCLGVGTTYFITLAMWRATRSRWPLAFAAILTSGVAILTFLGGWMIADILWVGFRIAKMTGLVTQDAPGPAK